MISQRHADILNRFKQQRGTPDDKRPQCEITLSNMGDGLIEGEFHWMPSPKDAHVGFTIPNALKENGFNFSSNYRYVVPQDEQDNGPDETRHLEEVFESIRVYLEERGWEAWEKKKDNIANTGGRYIIYCTYLK